MKFDHKAVRVGETKGIDSRTHSGLECGDQTEFHAGGLSQDSYMQMGCLIKHSTQGWGELTTWGRT